MDSERGIHRHGVVARIALAVAAGLALLCGVGGLVSLLHTDLELTLRRQYEPLVHVEGAVQSRTLRVGFARGFLKVNRSDHKYTTLLAMPGPQPSGGIERLVTWWKLDCADYRVFELQCASWIPFVLFGVPPAMAFVRGPLRRWRRRRAGCCLACGYDLTGNVSGVCPECATPTGIVPPAERVAPPRDGNT
jgi:hypothetical protein